MSRYDEARMWSTLACITGKRAFVTRRGAKQATKSAALSGYGKMDAFQCGTCGYWHMGHRRGWK